MVWKRACLVVLALFLSAGIANAQQTRIITGTVSEAGTGEVVAGAAVLVKGTSLGALTEMDGSFTLAGVPVGEVVLMISSTSHQPAEITVAPEQGTVKVELTLAENEQIIVTGRAPQIFRNNLANGASVVNGDALTEAGSSTIDDAMQGKIAGANIQSNSGAPGGGMQVKLRGVSTIAGRTDILYVVDGVIVSDTAIASGINAVTRAAAGSNGSNQDNPSNRIADLNPNDIESIEVLKGASAAALYGSKASNGVVVITTKRGRVGKPKVSVTQRLGFAQISNTLGSRYYATEQEAVDALGPVAAGLYNEVDGRPLTFDHEREITQSKLARETSASVSGGSKETRYLLSTSLRDEPGIIKGTGYSKETLRAAVDQDFGKGFKMSVTSNLIHSVTSRGMTNNDNNGVSHYIVFSSTPSFIDLRQYDNGTYPTNPFVGTLTNPLQTVALMSDSDEVWRNISSVATNWSAWSNDEHALTLTANLGLDRFQQRTDLFFPRELNFEPIDDGLAGTVIAGTAESRRMNWGINIIHNFVPRAAKLRSVTTAGFYYDENKLNIDSILAEGLAAGLGSIEAGVSVQADETRILEKDQAVAVQEEVLLLDERLALLAALLADRSSNNGDPNKFFFYPKVSAAYRVPTEQYRDIGLLRVRGAYGETGNKPRYDDKFTNLPPGTSIDGNAGIGLDTTGRAGNPDVKPERQREVEIGADVTGWDGRAVAELTLYQRNISDLLLRRALAPSTGFALQTSNIASLRNRGVELMLQVTPVRTPELQWLSRAVLSLNRSKITDLDVDPFRIGGFGVSLGAFWIEEGASATQIVGNSPDAEGPVKLGDAEPDFRVSFVNDLSWKSFTLHSLFDWQQGSDIINLTRLLYDGSQNSADYLDERGGAWRIETWANGDTSVYIEDASFLKLRELSLSYNLPPELVKQMGAMNSAQVKVSARNLLTLTSYSGLDPEVSNFGRQSIARNIDVAPYPPSRSFWISVEAGF